MTKIPIKTRLPLGAWIVAVLVTLYSLATSVAHTTTGTPSTLHAELTSANATLTTSSIR